MVMDSIPLESGVEGQETSSRDIDQGRFTTSQEKRAAPHVGAARLC